MGCTYNVPTLRKNKVESPVGVLRIQIQKIFIDQHNPIFKDQQNGLLLSISNHQFQIAPTLLNQCRLRQQKIQFTCFINSFYKQFGRIMMATLYNKQIDKKFNNQTRAFGIVDLNPFIQNKTDKQQIKCHINFSKTCIGYLNLKIKFQKLNYYKLRLVVDEFVLNKNQSVNHNNELIKRLSYCKVIAGEEILETDLSPETDNHNATWNMEKLEFYIPQGLDQIQIQIFEKKKNENDILIGQGVMNLAETVNANIGTKFNINITDTINNVGHIALKILQEGVDQQFLSKKCIQSMRVIQGKSDKDRDTQSSSNYILTQKRLPPIKNKPLITSIDNLVIIEQKKQQMTKKLKKQVSLKFIPEQQQNKRYSNIIPNNQLQPNEAMMIKTNQQQKYSVRIPQLSVGI